MVRISRRGASRRNICQVEIASRFGPSLRRPHVGSIRGSQHQNLKEIVVQHKGDPWRILFAFDPNRKAILLVGGNKRGDNRWYEKNVPIADARYKTHLEEIESKDRK